MPPTSDNSELPSGSAPAMPATNGQAVVAPAARSVAVSAAQVPAELAGVLLPTERVTFATGPHWVTLVHPVVSALLIAIAFTVALSWDVHPVVRGHHITEPLIGGTPRLVVLIIFGALLLREALLLALRLTHYFGYRIVTTNRRVFVVEGIVGRRVRPFGNTALASSRLVQGPLGRWLGYGTVIVGGEAANLTSGGALRDLREPVELYHEIEAVALGVDGDTWAQPVRQTLVP